MGVLEAAGVCPLMLSFVLDPLACGAALVCSSWAAGLAQHGALLRKRRQSTEAKPADLRLDYYLSIGAVQPRPGNASAGILAHAVPYASSDLVFPFGTGTGPVEHLRLGWPGYSLLKDACLAAFLAPDDPPGIRTEWMSKRAFLLGVVGYVEEALVPLSALVSARSGLERPTSMQGGLSVGPFCVGLLWRSNSLVAVGVGDNHFLDDPANGWVGGVYAEFSATAEGEFCFFARVSPNCLAVVYNYTSMTGWRFLIVAAVCWTQARGLVVSKVRDDPALDPLQGWQIPPLDADASTQPVVVFA